MADPTTTARRSLASRFFKLREGGMSREQMLKGGFDRKDWDDSSKKTLEDMGNPDFTSFVDRLYAGKFDTLGTKQARRQRERQDFTRQQKSLKVGREAAFMDKMAQQKKESAAKFGVAHEVETPGLDRQEAMQKAAFGGNTATAGSVLKFNEQRDISPSSAPHGVAERAAGRAGDVAGARAHREAKLKAREERGGILKQEQRGRLQEKEKEVARQQAKLGKAQRRRDKTAKITAKEALHRAKEAKNARKKGK